MARRGFTIVFTLLGVALVVSMAGVFALYFLFGREPAVPANATLTLRLGGDLAEVAPADIIGYVSGGARTPTVRSLIDNLRKAKVDARVSAVLLKPTGFTTPFWGKIQELRDAVLDFKKSGKPIYAYLEYGGDRDYYLASAADKVFLMPSSSLDLTGVATYALFLRGTLDKVGAYPDLHHIGDYKTASNTFTEKGLHRGAPRNGPLPQPRPVRADHSRHRRRAQAERGRRASADRRGAVRARGRAARRTDRRRRV